VLCRSGGVVAGLQRPLDEFGPSQVPRGAAQRDVAASALPAPVDNRARSAAGRAAMGSRLRHNPPADAPVPDESTTHSIDWRTNCPHWMRHLCRLSTASRAAASTPGCPRCFRRCEAPVARCSTRSPMYGRAETTPRRAAVEAATHGDDVPGPPRCWTQGEQAGLRRWKRR
jgi:hypothetical protein